MCVSSLCKNLERGGVLILTIPDKRVIERRLRDCGGLSFGNSLYKIDFRKRPDFGAQWGSEYYFTLSEAVPNLPESIISRTVLIQMMEHYGMKLDLDYSFHDFREFCRGRGYRKDVFEMRVFRDAGGIPRDQDEVVSLYRVFGFVKL